MTTPPYIMEEKGIIKAQPSNYLSHFPHIIGKGGTKALPAHRAQAQSDPLVQEKSDETLCLEISQSKETNGKQRNKRK